MTDSGFEFVWPWLFLLSPVPLLVYYFVPARAREDNSAIWLPFFSRLQHYSDSNPPATGRTKQLRLWLLFIIWLLVLCAGARPQWVSEAVEFPTQARDLMVAVDISLSMEEQDMVLNNRRVRRIDMVKHVLGDFIERRQGDRIGLIVFGSQAYLHAPLTFDLKTVQTYLNELQLGFAGRATAIGDALGLAVKRLQKRPSEQRILILLTDGSNTAGSIEPLEAAQLAAQENLKIYTIGIGSGRGSTSKLLGNLLGGNIRLGGNELDEKTLNQIAQTTNGKYFRAKSTQDLNAVYSTLDRLEPIEQNDKRFKLQESLFHVPLSLAAVLAFLLALFAQPNERPIFLKKKTIT